MSCRSGGTSCSLPGMISYIGWYGWGGEKYLGDLRFWIARDDWRVSWCFRSLYIAAILWNIIQDSLVSLCDAWLLLNMDTFTNPEQDFFWISCSSSFLFTRLITSQKYLMDDCSFMLLSQNRYLMALKMFYSCCATPWQSKGRPWPPSIPADANTNDSSSSFR